MVIYIKEKKKYKQKIEKKKKKNSVATVPLGTVTTVQNFLKKKKMANQNGAVDEQCKNTVEKRAQINDQEKIKKKFKKKNLKAMNSTY